jgi:hypothetical protein
MKHQVKLCSWIMEISASQSNEGQSLICIKKGKVVPVLKHNTMKTYGRAAFLTLTLNAGEQSASLPWEEHLAPIR